MRHERADVPILLSDTYCLHGPDYIVLLTYCEVQISLFVHDRSYGKADTIKRKIYLFNFFALL